MEVLEIRERIKKAFDDPNFLYNEDEHRYFYKTPEKTLELDSTNKYIDQFKNEFDPHGHILFACAKKEGITPSEVKRQWRETAKIGTQCHSYIERFRETGVRKEEYPRDIYPIHAKKIQAFWSIFDRQLKDYASLFPEGKVFSLKYGVAGGLDDLLLINGKPSVVDYKTNDKLRVNKGYLKPPFSFLPDTSKNQYALQLAVYKVIIEDATGLELGPSYLIWLGNPEGELIEVADISKEMRTVLKQRVNKWQMFG